MADFITEIRERRVLPAVGVYVASCWVVVEILDRLVDRYLLSPYLTDIVFWGLFSLIPAVCLIAWSYGRPGKDTATRAQKVGVPINVIATAGLLFTLFDGKDLGITAEYVSATNEDGVEETVIVPREAYKRRLAVFFYDNESGDETLDWLQYGATELLTQDLQQDPFLYASSPYSGWGAGFYGRLKAAGFEDGLGAPASLLRDIARDANRDYFAEGDVRQEGEELVLVTRLWDVESMNQVRVVEQRGWDLYRLMDETSVKLREAMGVPSVGSRGHEDLPLAETYGESEAALKAYLEGLNARLIANDPAAAIGYMDQALAEDTTFVLALFTKGLILTEAGNMPAAAESFDEAQKRDYRLPANDRSVLKAMYYRTTGQSEKLMDFLRLQVRLQDDSRWHAQLASLLMVNGELADAQKHFEIALEKDDQNSGLLLTLSDLSRSQGDMSGAIDYAERYQGTRPDEMEAYIKLGDLLRDSGDLDDAERQYQQAQLIEDDAVDPLLRLHVIAARRGDVARARALLEQALDTAETAGHLAAVHMTAHYFETRLGRVDAAIAQLRAAEPYLAQSQAPFSVVFAIDSPLISLHLRRNDLASARASLEEARTRIPAPPMNQFLEPFAALIAAYEGEFESAWSHLGSFETVLEQLNFNGINFQVPLVACEIAFHEGDYAAATRHLEEGIEQIDGSFIAGELNTHAVPYLLSQLAEYQVLAGQLDDAESSLERGFRLDPSLPNLFVARARLQKQRGQDELAQASVNYALAIWENADPALLEYRLAEELAGSVLTGGP